MHPISAQVEDDSLFDENGEVRETGTLDEETGEVRRPWCPATRILDHLENVSVRGIRRHGACCHCGMGHAASGDAGLVGLGDIGHVGLGDIGHRASATLPLAVYTIILCILDNLENMCTRGMTAQGGTGGGGAGHGTCTCHPMPHIENVAYLRMYAQEKANREADEKKRSGAAKKDGPDVGDLKPRRLEDFPEIKDGEK
jgi:hypothetical protein